VKGPAIILPVHNGAGLLPAALDGLLAAVRPLDGNVIVVDDASTDDTSAVATEAGADVIRREIADGPYAGRNAGWQASGADVAVFVDVRCRPRAGWLPALLAALEEPGAALAAGEVVVRGGETLAARAMARLQPLAAKHGRGSVYLPYAPTCHLAVPTAVLEKVGGFRPVRGGGDVDFCWRVQLAGLGHIAWADGAVLEWEPRRRVRDLLEQYHRYGANTRRLYRAYHDRGCPESPATSPLRLTAYELTGLIREPVRSWPVRAIEGAARVAYGVGYRRAGREPVDTRLG